MMIHSNLTTFSNTGTGRRGIQEFLSDHSEGCQKNWICRKLGLDKVVTQPRSPEKGKAVSPLSSSRASKKLKMSYILADSDDDDLE